MLNPTPPNRAPVESPDVDRFAMLVVSCDPYSDLWEPCFRLLDKYWPERGFDIHLMSNFMDFEWPRVNVIKVGADVSYADNLRAAIERIPEQWLLLWLEDLLLCSPVDTNRVMSIIRSAQRRGAGYLKLSPDMPLSYDAQDRDEIGPIPRGVRYRSAIGASFYHRSTLLQLLTPGASAWDLDKSTVCDDMAEEFLALTVQSARNPPIPHLNAVIKGRWTRGATTFLKSEGLGSSLDRRVPETAKNFLYRKLYLLRLAVLRSFRVHWR